MNAALIIVSILKGIILSIAAGIFAIVLTINKGIIRRQAAICLLLVFYSIPAFIALFYNAESTTKSESAHSGLGFGFTIFTIFIQVVLGYVAGEIIFRKKISTQIKENE